MRDCLKLRLEVPNLKKYRQLKVAFPWFRDAHFV